MEAVDKFRIVLIPGDELRSYLVSNENSSMEIEGQMIEAQFRCSRGYLVITSDGNPFEEMMHFYFLDGDGRPLDQLSLGQIYHSGTLRDLDLKSDDRLEFSFFGSERWCLSILDKAHIQSPGLFSPVRRSNGLLASHYLCLKKCS